jgi:CheY-like chemotaxis protein
VIIDDNEDARELVATMLQGVGHEVRLAHDGPSGLAAILEHEPDAALIDIGLPGMTGVDVVRALRGQRPDLRTRLVAYTGYSGAEAIQHTTQAGFHDHLAKPATIDKVLRCLAVNAEQRAVD